MTIIVNGSNTPTAGAVGYGDGTNLAFTSAGTTGQFLSSNGSSAPSWVGAPASAMTLISTQTITSATGNAYFTNLSGYDKYLIIFENVNSGINLLLGYGSTPTYITTGWYWTGSATTTSITNANQSNTSSIGVVGSVVNNPSSSYGASGSILITNMTNGSNASVLSNGTFYVSGGQEYDTYNGTLTGNTTVKTAIRLQLFSSPTTGVISLYGISS